MESLYLLIPISVALVFVAGWGFWRALDSGQLDGMLTGMKGAAEYEQLTGATGLALPAMAGQSFAHLYIFVLIVLGNIAMFTRWMGRRAR